MVFKSRSKVQKQRGKRTHGWGHGKKHRGAGNRGGRGKAGLGKRGAQKKTLPLSQGKKPVGRIANNNIGMKKIRNSRNNTIINLENIVKNLPNWIKNKKVKKDGSKYTLDLGELGYNKLLSKGEISEKMEIKVSKYSASAKNKVEKAGGKILE
jgi:large subunit ribosomal protein L15|tara:strand:+ start:884 stop:1342 length:459 start_codon:yes stop_codon:yes gene_type:complete